MYRNKLTLILLVFVITLGVTLYVFNAPRSTSAPLTPSSLSMPGSCTVYAIEQDGEVFLGNNEDYSNPSTYFWTTASSTDQYGAIYLGYEEGSAQGGINEKGLAFDGLALDPEPLNVHPGWPGTGPCFTCFMQDVLGSCANVEEAAEMITSYNWGSKAYHQILIADASGDAAVISVGSDGELVVTRKAQGDGYLLATNFNVVQLSNPDFVIPCNRYAGAREELEKIIDKQDMSIKRLFDVLDNVHQQGAINNTLYSNVFDLKNGVMYLAYWYQFNEIVTIDVLDEIAKGPHVIRIKTLFSERTLAKADRAFKWLYLAPMRARTVTLIWLIVNLICGCAVFADLLRNPDVPWRIKVIWFCVGITLGALGVLAYWLAFKPLVKGKSLGKFSRAVGSAAITASAVALTFAAISLIAALTNWDGSLGPFALLIPLVISLVLFRAPLKAYTYHLSYRKSIVEAILPELVSVLVAVISVILTDTWLKAYLDQLSINFSDPGEVTFWLLFMVYALVVIVVVSVLHIIAIALKLNLWPERLVRGAE